MPLHASRIKCTILIPFLLFSASAWASDLQCQSTQQPAQRVICDHAILNHEYDDIFAQQQALIQQGKLSPNDLAAWKQKRDSCADVHCIDTVFAQWSSIDKGLANSPAAPAMTASEAIGPAPGMTASEALGPAPGMTASEALGTVAGVSAVSPAAAVGAASDQASGVPVSRQGSAYGVALPQAVSSDASAPVPASVAPANVQPGSGIASNPLLGVLGVLLVIAALSVGAIVIYRRRRAS